uniref:Uncharacterized protein n=1 Tax=Arundo donax TaxID=35708 RepID=A0A0A8Z6C9_ARUDO
MLLPTAYELHNRRTMFKHLTVKMID